MAYELRGYGENKVSHGGVQCYPWIAFDQGISNRKRTRIPMLMSSMPISILYLVPSSATRDTLATVIRIVPLQTKRPQVNLPHFVIRPVLVLSSRQQPRPPLCPADHRHRTWKQRCRSGVHNNTTIPTYHVQRHNGQTPHNQVSRGFGHELQRAAGKGRTVILPG